MRACEEYIDLITRSIDGRTDGQEEAALHVHLMTCPGCKALYDSYRAIDDGIYFAQEEPPEGLTDAIMNGIYRERTQYRPKSWLRRGKFTMIAAAAAVLVLVFAQFGGNLGAQTTESDLPETVAAAEAVPEVSAEFRSGPTDAPEPYEAAPAVQMPEVPITEAEEEPEQSPEAKENSPEAPSGSLQAGTTLSSAEVLRQALVSAGCSGRIFLAEGITQDELVERLPESTAVVLDNGQTAVGANADSVQALLDDGSLTASELFSIGDGDLIWIVIS